MILFETKTITNPYLTQAIKVLIKIIRLLLARSFVLPIAAALLAPLLIAIDGFYRAGVMPESINIAISAILFWPAYGFPPYDPATTGFTEQDLPAFVGIWLLYIVVIEFIAKKIGFKNVFRWWHIIILGLVLNIAMILSQWLASDQLVNSSLAALMLFCFLVISLGVYRFILNFVDSMFESAFPTSTEKPNK